MGIAAYNRGTAAIRRQIDQELSENAGAIRERMELNRLQEERDKLAKQLATIQNDMDRARACIARLRATLAVERDESRQRIEHLEKRNAFWRETAGSLRRSWFKASDLIRACLTPEQVDEYRQHRDLILGK